MWPMGPLVLFMLLKGNINYNVYTGFVCIGCPDISCTECYSKCDNEILGYQVPNERSEDI